MKLNELIEIVKFKAIELAKEFNLEIVSTKFITHTKILEVLVGGREKQNVLYLEKINKGLSHFLDSIDMPLSEYYLEVSSFTDNSIPLEYLENYKGFRVIVNDEITGKIFQVLKEELVLIHDKKKHIIEFSKIKKVRLV